MRSGMMPAPRAGLLAAVLGLCLLSIGPAFADGGGGSNGGGGNTTGTCNRGEVWDAYSRKCVKQQSGVLPDKALTDYAFALAQAQRYDEALDVLNLLKDPNTAVALNYRGYVTRQLGRLDEGIGYYLKSIALDPRYAQVREYLGEAYVMKGDYPHANEQLAAIKGICGTGCEEYAHLAKAITNRSVCGGRYAGARCPS